MMLRKKGRSELSQSAELAGLASISRRSACQWLLAVAGVNVASALSASLRCAEARSLEVREIDDGVFVHTGRHALQGPDNLGDISNAGFVIGGEAVAVIDTSGSYAAGSALRETIKQHTQKPIRYVINTHMHPDHVLGNAAFIPDHPSFVGHHKLARALGARADRYLAAGAQAIGKEAFRGTEVVLPDHGVLEVETLDLGGRKLRLSPMPTAHTDNDLVVSDERTGTVFVGDLVFSGHVPALDGSILGWIEVLKSLGTAPPPRIVPGHGPASMGWAEASEPMLRYLGAIVRDVRRIINQGGTIREAMETAAEDEKGKWELFDSFHKRNVSAAFAELEWE
jgi:quinoprotein relay system zinc metallohydrolase 2